MTWNINPTGRRTRPTSAPGDVATPYPRPSPVSQRVSGPGPSPVARLASDPTSPAVRGDEPDQPPESARTAPSERPARSPLGRPLAHSVSTRRRSLNMRADREEEGDRGTRSEGEESRAGGWVVPRVPGRPTATERRFTVEFDGCQGEISTLTMVKGGEGGGGRAGGKGGIGGRWPVRTPYRQAIRCIDMFTDHAPTEQEGHMMFITVASVVGWVAAGALIGSLPRRVFTATPLLAAVTPSRHTSRTRASA